MKEPTRGVDVIATLLVGLLLVELALVLGAQRLFSQMYADFGGSLPGLTRLMLSPWLPGGAVLATIGFTLEGVVRRRPEAALVVRLVTGLVVAVALVVLFVVAAYQPIFSLAEGVR